MEKQTPRTQTEMPAGLASAPRVLEAGSYVTIDFATYHVESFEYLYKQPNGRWAEAYMEHGVDGYKRTLRMCLERANDARSTAYPDEIDHLNHFPCMPAPPDAIALSIGDVVSIEGRVYRVHGGINGGCYEVWLVATATLPVPRMRDIIVPATPAAPRAASMEQALAVLSVAGMELVKEGSGHYAVHGNGTHTPVHATAAKQAIASGKLQAATLANRWTLRA